MHLTRVRRDKCKLDKRKLIVKMFVPHDSCSHYMRSKPKCKHSFIHSFFICQIYKNFTMQGWNNDIKEKVNGEET